MAAEYVFRLASVGEYRERSIKLLMEEMGDCLTFQAGDRSPDGTVKVLDSTTTPGIVTLRNYYLPAQILWQFTALRPAVQARVLVLDFNPRVLHVWLLLLVRKFRRGPTLLWGHAWPRQGSPEKPGVLRTVLRRLSTGLITYTHTQAQQLAERQKDILAFAAPNAIYYRKEFSFSSGATRDTFIYVGRLVPEKKPDLLIKAFELAWQRNQSIRLVIAGDGPLFRELRNRVVSSPARGSIEMVGHVSDYESVKQLYSEALAAISPGYAGLSITQSHAFGVPLLVSRDEPHAPEIEAIIPGFNGTFF